jgi:putative hydrolase of the HAD superfamily
MPLPGFEPGQSVEAVLFDFYNTLIAVSTDEDEAEVWARLARFLRYHGHGHSPDALRTDFVTTARHRLLSAAETYPETDVHAIFASVLQDHRIANPELIRQVVLLFRTLMMRHFCLFPDTLAVLESLRSRLRLGLVTDAQALLLEGELDMVGLRPYFDVVVVSGPTGFRKPDTRLFHTALRAIEVEPGAALFVGDNLSRDVCGAKAAGLCAVLIDREATYGSDSSSCAPDLIIRTLADLPTLLGHNSGGHAPTHHARI